MLRFLLSLAFVFSIACPAFPQSADSLFVNGRQMLHAGENQGSLDAMYAARAMFERALADTSLAAWAHYYIALADYRIVNLLLAEGEKNKDPASEHLDSAVGNLKEATRINPRAAEAYALLSSAYGRQISLSPVKSMFLGPKAGKAIRKAVQLAPDNPRVVLSAAIGDFNTPKMFGGSKERAMQGFRRAAELFAREKPADPVEPVWGHSEAYAWLGLACLDREEKESAGAAFEKALEINPDFGWVKYVLLPSVWMDTWPDPGGIRLDRHQVWCTR